MSHSLVTDATSLKEIAVALQNGFVCRRIHIKFASKTCCTVPTLFVSANFTKHEIRYCGVSAILHFTALWRRAGKLKIS
jgi:hypothetical protein